MSAGTRLIDELAVLGQSDLRIDGASVTFWDGTVLGITPEGSQTEIRNIKYCSRYAPVVGDLVLVLKRGRDWIVLDSLKG